MKTLSARLLVIGFVASIILPNLAVTHSDAAGFKCLDPVRFQPRDPLCPVLYPDATKPFMKISADGTVQIDWPEVERTAAKLQSAGPVVATAIALLAVRDGTAKPLP